MIIYISAMKAFKVSEKIFLNHDVNVVWNTISSQCALELFHPFCQKNFVLSWNEIKIDKLIYLNGLIYIREFTSWKPDQGFELNIGKKNGKKSKVKWEILSIDRGCEITISILPYKSSKVSKLYYPFINFFIIKPRLKKYLKSVLFGLKYYLDHDVTVEKNQFGSHPWFS